MKRLYSTLLIVLVAGGAVCAEAPEWAPEVVTLFSTLPVQESGRVKPLDTVARFTLLRLAGRRSLRLEDGSSRSAMEWMLDCFFFPQFADTCRCFTVESYDAVIAMGVEPRGKKRDRYSYEDLRPGIDRLMALARQASETDAHERSFLDSHIISLANNILAYEALTRFLEFTRVRFDTLDSSLFATKSAEGDTIALSEVLLSLPERLSEISAASGSMSEEEKEPLAHAMREVFTTLDTVLASAQLFALVAPESKDVQEWYTPADIIEAAFDAEFPGKPPVEIIQQFELLMGSLPDTAIFENHLKALHASLTGRAKARDEYNHISLEVHYYRFNYLFYAQWFFVLAFILTACSWLQPTPGRLSLLINFSLLPPMLLLAAGITLRCIIRGRPPVTTLYETILFSVFIAALLGFVLEFISRNRISMSIAALLGAFGMFFAWRYEAREGADTMPAVIAVLDTNFWLATHVTTIVVGYGAGLFASALGHVYVFARSLGLKRKSPGFYGELERVIYGVLAFSLLFTLIGTVLGGVWAAQSWGRFWGWDPKENGALLIVLWALAVLHARRGGYIRRDGLAISVILLGMIVVFAWWGVNALGVGLHSYGFTTGIWRTLAVFWLVEAGIVAAGLTAIKLRPLTRVRGNPE